MTVIKNYNLSNKGDKLYINIGINVVNIQDVLSIS